MAPISSGATPLSLPGGNPAQLGPTNAPLTDVVNRNMGQRPKRRKATMTRKIAFAQKTQAFAGKVTI